MLYRSFLTSHKLFLLTAIRPLARHLRGRGICRLLDCSKRPLSPNATGLQNDFAVEGEQRYWLHIAIGRDLTTTTNPPTVDVLGTQLEEVTQ